MANSPPSKCFETESVLSNTSSRTAIKSSTTSTAVTVEVNFWCFSFRSSKLLMIIVVEEMLSIHPRKMQSIDCHPSACPTKLPIKNISRSSVRAVMAPVAPTFFSFLMLNSSPKANIRKTIPMSLHT